MWIFMHLFLWTMYFKMATGCTMSVTFEAFFNTIINQHHVVCYQFVYWLFFTWVTKNKNKFTYIKTWMSVIFKISIIIWRKSLVHVHLFKSKVYYTKYNWVHEQPLCWKQHKWMSCKARLVIQLFSTSMTIAVLKQLDCIISFINNGCSIRYYLSDQDYSWRTK